MIKLDKNHKFFIASLVGKTASKFLDEKTLNIDSVVVFFEGAAYQKSQAIFLILVHLFVPKLKSLLWKLSPFWFFDILYDIVAKARKSIFKKKPDACMFETLQNRFLD